MYPNKPNLCLNQHQTLHLSIFDRKTPTYPCLEEWFVKKVFNWLSFSLYKSKRETFVCLFVCLFVFYLAYDVFFRNCYTSLKFYMNATVCWEPFLIFPKKKLKLPFCRGTMKPRLTATSVIRSPRYYGHFFGPPGKNRHTYSCKKNPR